MSDERRRQQRRERQRRRDTGRNTLGPAQPVGAMELPGVFGWVQRNGRFFALIGMVVLLLSLGGGFLLRQNNSTTATDDSNPTPIPELSSTPSPTATPAFGPTGTPSPDGVFRTYTSEPPLTINEHGKYEAVLHTEKGDIRIQLLPEASPDHVNNFIYLAQHQFFDGLSFHRVIPGFVAQAGDPLGNSTGGPGYILEKELNSVPFDTAGIVSMAAGADGVSGSQFFITMDAEPSLKQSGFTAFGKVTEGLDVVKSLTARDPAKTNQPPGDRILKVEIIQK